MAEDAMDRYWTDVVDHARTMGVADCRIVAPREFGNELSLVGSYETPLRIDAVDALVVHKGRLAELSPALLSHAIDAFSVVFANEVFIILARDQPAASPNPDHLADWDLVLDRAAESKGSPTGAPHLQMRLAGRMPASYLGDGRVLLETAFGHLMLAAGADTSITPHLIRDGWFDYGVTSLLNRYLRPGMTYIDVGANFGTYALIAAAIVGEAGRVVAVEAVPRIAGLLHETLVMNGFGGLCQVVREAAGAVEGSCAMFEFATRQGGNTMVRHVADEAERSYGEVIVAYDVPCRPLDLIAADVHRVDFIKIDVEGFEQNVLEGARNIIATNRPALLLEWHPSFFTDVVGESRALHELLTKDFGYSLARVEADGTVREIGFDELVRLPHSDILATPST